MDSEFGLKSFLIFVFLTGSLEKADRGNEAQKTHKVSVLGSRVYAECVLRLVESGRTQRFPAKDPGGKVTRESPIQTLVSPKT